MTLQGFLGNKVWALTFLSWSYTNDAPLEGGIHPSGSAVSLSSSPGLSIFMGVGDMSVKGNVTNPGGSDAVVKILDFLGFVKEWDLYICKVFFLIHK